jgi:hypothetical protein
MKRYALFLLILGLFLSCVKGIYYINIVNNTSDTITIQTWHTGFDLTVTLTPGQATPYYGVEKDNYFIAQDLISYRIISVNGTNYDYYGGVIEFSNMERKSNNSIIIVNDRNDHSDPKSAPYTYEIKN